MNSMKKATSKYGDTHYYQAYKDKQNVRMNQNSKNHFEEINKQLNMFLTK